MSDQTQQPDEPTTNEAASGSEKESQGTRRVVVVGPDGQPIGQVEVPDTDEGDGEGGSPRKGVTDMVEQPAKVMRIGNMIRQLLDEVKAAPLDDASRQRLREIHSASIAELKDGLAPELVEELDRLALPFTADQAPSDAELRIAQAQLVGWLEGLFHGIQTALFAQQMATRAQLEQMRRALPQGMSPGQEPQPQDPRNSAGGMYL